MYKNLFKKVSLLQKGKNKENIRIIIDIETLEIYPTMKKCAEKLGVSSACVCNRILEKGTVKGHKLEYFNDWQHWTDAEKEKHTRKNNIYFLRGEKL